jgi:hypothetical protein
MLGFMMGIVWKKAFMIALPTVIVLLAAIFVPEEAVDLLDLVRPWQTA